MLPCPQPIYTFEDYLATERAALEVRHEYVAGETFAMTGASWAHNLITANLVGELRQRLKAGPCAVLSADMRVRIASADACLYPDVSVVCDAPRFHDGRRDVLLNPILVAEVLSPFTESYDRGGKFALYRQLPSLRHYLLIAQDRPAVEIFARQPDGRWLLEDGRALDATVALGAIGCELPLRELYARVAFD